jgi:ribosomal protein S18 acetylase RimI-like enzyme
VRLAPPASPLVVTHSHAAPAHLPRGALGASMVDIRPADPDDAAAVRRVARAGWHAAYDDVIGADRVDDTVDEWYASDAVRRDVRDDDRPFLVAVDPGDGGGSASGEGDVVGFAAVTPDGPGETPEDAWELYRIYVHPDRWGEGVGSALLERCEEVVRERGGRALALSVFADNEVGVSFYRSRGFEHVETTHDEGFDAEVARFRTEL